MTSRKLDSAGASTWRLLAGTLACVILIFAFPLAAEATLTPEEFEKCLLTEINEDRARAGMAAVAMDHRVNVQARQWSIWMSENEFRHMTTAERTSLLPDWAQATGENIARTSRSLSSCEYLHDLFMDSPGHRANILSSSPKFVALGAHLGGSVWYITEVFFTGTGSFGCDVCNDEMFFYMDDGTYRFYDVRADGRLGSRIRSGNGYSSGWDTITAVDLG